MSKRRVAVVLAVALALQGCSFFDALGSIGTVKDRYGNTYGDYYGRANQYAWQLQTCDQEMAASTLPDGQKKRAMQCCMWRHGVPIDDATGCVAG